MPVTEAVDIRFSQEIQQPGETLENGENHKMCSGLRELPSGGRPGKQTREKLNFALEVRRKTYLSS